MTLTTYRSPAVRTLHATLDLALRLRRTVAAWTASRPPRAQALAVLDDAALRDLGIVRAEFESYGADVRGEPSLAYPRSVGLQHS